MVFKNHTRLNLVDAFVVVSNFTNKINILNPKVPGIRVA